MATRKCDICHHDKRDTYVRIIKTVQVVICDECAAQGDWDELEKTIEFEWLEVDSGKHA